MDQSNSNKQVFTPVEYYELIKRVASDIIFTLKNKSKYFIYPKIQKNKTGILIAINYENEKEETRLNNDLIYNLKRLLSNISIPPHFEIIKLDKEVAKKIQTHEEAVVELNKTKATLILYGLITTRTHQGKLNYHFKLDAAILHKPIPINVSNKFSIEMSELFPRNNFFPESDEILGFEIAADWIGYVSEYVIGIAAFLSGDINIALNLYENLNSNLNKIQNIKNIPALLKVKQRLKIRFIEVAILMCRLLYVEYSRTRNLNYIERLKKYIDLADKYAPNEYSFSLVKSIYLFLIENNVDEAINTLLYANKTVDRTWRYNIAFLYAFKDDLKEAKKQYDKAIDPVEGNIINDCDIFISEEINKYPNKTALYYARGYLNYVAKGDNILAQEDFNKFIELSTKNKSFEKEQNEIEGYLRIIRTTVNILKNKIKN